MIGLIPGLSLFNTPLSEPTHNRSSGCCFEFETYCRKQNMIENGIFFSQEITVGHKDTAVSHGSGNLEVFATPAMVALMENTSVKCLKGFLDNGTDTVGVEINVRHTKATAIGKKVTCKATVTEVDGRRIRFEIETWDEKDQIGYATHDRFIIYPEKFMSKL